MAPRSKHRGLLTDAIAMLKADHHKIRTLFIEYQTAMDPATMRSVAHLVFVELETHAQLEEHVFYPAYEAMTGKHGTQLVADSRLAHEHVRELMIELQGIDLDEAAFEGKFHELMGIVREHIAEEENAMFPEAEQILADQLEDLMDHMVELKQQLTPSPQQ